MNVDNELTDFDAAGSLAEELPWWGWLEDGRSCLTRAGELMAIARLTPSVLDGQTPEQLDRVVDRWQRMLSGVDSRTRLYFYLLRRPIRFERQDEDEGSSVDALGRRKRRAFLEKRVQSVSAYVDLSPGPPVGTPRSGHLKKAALATRGAGGRMIRAYPPSPLKRVAGRGGWPMQRTGWRGGAINMNRFTLNPLSRRRRGASGNWSKQAGRWSMTSRRYGCLTRRKRRSS